MTMTGGASSDNQGTSTRPYLLRALHDWCTDNGFTPYLAVHVRAGVQVPMEYVKNNEIVLNVSFEATSGLKLGNEFVEFRARFGGVTREIAVPVDHVIAIYARENGQGMAFPMPADGDSPVLPIAEAAGPRGLRLATAAPDDPDTTDEGAAGSGQGPAPVPQAAGPAPDDPPDPAQPPSGGRPALKRIK
jgi:stringent starvation protein B